MPHLSEGGSRYTGSYRQRPHSSLGDYSSYANDYARDYNGYHDGYPYHYDYYSGNGYNNTGYNGDLNGYGDSYRRRPYSSLGDYRYQVVTALENDIRYLLPRYDGGYRNSGYSRSNPNIAKVISNAKFVLLK